MLACMLGIRLTLIKVYKYGVSCKGDRATYLQCIYHASIIVSGNVREQHSYWSELESNLKVVLARSRAPSTSAQYDRAWEKWTRWTFDNKVGSLPAEPKVVALYLAHIGKSVSSFSSVKSVYSAIAWKHGINGFMSPTLSPLVIETIAGLKRVLAKPVKKKDPFMVEHMQRLHLMLIPGCLTDLRNNCILIIAFFGFLRVEEIIHLTFGDVVFLVSHVELNLPRSKCDQLRQGSLVVISRLDSFCPVALLESYMKVSGSRPEDSMFVFRRIVYQKGAKFLCDKNLPLKYSNVRDIVKAKAAQLGLNPQGYSTHSMRAGGSTAAANAGVGDRLFQRHGRWASAASKDGYVLDNLADRLSVTQALT
jgi:integrase